MAQDGVSRGANGIAKKHNGRSADPRIVPAIPHALDKKRRQKPQQVQATKEECLPEASTTPAPGVTPPVDITEEEIQATAGEQGQATALNNQEILLEASPRDVAPSNMSVSVQAVVYEEQPLADQNAPIEDPTDGHSVSPPPDDSFQYQPTNPMPNLPPSVQPSLHQSHASPSTSVSASIYHEQPAGTIQMPQPRVNGNDLVFGGYRDSANSSPAPPPPQGVPHPLQNPLPGLPPQGPGPASFYPAGLDPHATAIFPSPFVPGSKFVGPPQEMYNPLPPHVNHARPSYPGYPRFGPPPRRSEEPQFQQPYPTGLPRANGYYSGVPEPPRLPYPGHNMPVPQPSLPALQAQQQIEGEQAIRRPSNQFTHSLQDGNISLAQHVNSQFGNREFADYIIQISHSRYRFEPTTIPAHGIILARSPKLRSLMRMPQGYQGNQGYPKYLHIVVSDKFLGRDLAFLKALMRLYAETLPDRDFLMKLPIPAGLNPATAIHQEAMRFALAYAAAGHFLQIDEIITHALDLAAGVLSWDTMSSALTFALEGGLSPSFVQFEATATGAEDKASNSSFDDTPAKPESPVSAPTYGVYSDRMLHQVVGFLLHNCPPHFQFLPNAPQLHDLARLPASAEPKHHYTPSESRFSQIRFGEMSLQDGNERPDPAMMTISSVVLSLPFLLLKHILESHVLGERLGWAKVADVARAVVKEREARRQRAMASHGGAAPQSAVEERLWRNVRWVESAEPTESTPLRLKLVRHALGVETPGSGSGNSVE